MSWRFLAMNARGTGSLGETLALGEIAFDSVEFTLALSGIDTFTGHCFAVPEYYARFKPWGTIIYAEKDGDIRGGWIVTDVNIADSGLTVEADGFVSYLEDMPWPGEYSASNVDTFTVAKVIWDTVQAQKSANLGVELVFEPRQLSGVRVGVPESTTVEKGQKVEPNPYTLQWWSDFDLLSKWNELASVGNWDFRMSHEWDAGDKVAHTLTVTSAGFYSMRSDIRLTLGENVNVVPQLSADGKEYASTVTVLGAGEGRKMLRGTWTTNTNRLFRHKVITEANNRTKDMVTARAGVYAESFKALETNDITELIVSDHPNSRTGSIMPGDMLRVTGPSRGWAKGLDSWVLVTAVQHKPTETTDVTLSVRRKERISG